ncbi:MAG: hypothetical protein PHX05_05030 [Acidobacteriota bacterium]|jgi:hypothetical protein|nr:hypothetical protein [Acidobacteriota bacterium]
MQLLFYASKNDENENRLDAAIRSVTPGGTVERFVTLDDFRNRLRSIVEPNSIMVLAAVDREELLEMQAYRDMLTEIFIILVLPDRQESTIKLAHLLRPRFLSQVDDDFSELNQIIAKIIQTPHGPPPSPIASGTPSDISGTP